MPDVGPGNHARPLERHAEGVPEVPLDRVHIPALRAKREAVLAGMPQLDEGEEALLFLSARGDTGIRVPIGLAQGKYGIGFAEDGTKSLTRTVSDLSLIHGETGQQVPGSAHEVRTYVSVVAQIEAALVKKRADEARAQRVADEKEAR